MLFNSYIYIFLFLPAVVVIYFLMNRLRFSVAGKLFLVGASLFFYAWWEIKYLLLLVISVLFNYAISKLIFFQTGNTSESWRKILLFFGISANLLLLGFFKYADFFIANMNMVSGSELRLIHIALPLAISFFTFQQIAYLVDSFRGEVRNGNFLNYTLFVTFFPQLIAGPIVHHKEMMWQFERTESNRVNWENIYAGLVLFSMGLFKKVFVADTFAVWATAGFDQAVSLSFAEAWITSLSFTLQIYFDFSGYTDMAMGSARFFNIRLPQNFNSPYKATSIRDFWQRWHMTLSRWLKDYLFIPLGGSRCAELKVLRNLMITFLLGGLWHGAGWTFVIWGVMHGTAGVVHRIWRRSGFKLPALMAWMITFLFINVTWVFFRALDFQAAVKVLKGMVNFNGLLSGNRMNELFFISNMTGGKDVSGILAWILIFAVLAGMVKNSNQFIAKLRPSYQWAILTIIFLILGMPDFQQPSEFLYFNF